MMQLGVVLYRNYTLFRMFAEHHIGHLNGEDWELLVVDNTPHPERNSHLWPRHARIHYTEMDIPDAYDGVSCGVARDFLAEQMTTPIVGFLDMDFFWFDPDILQRAEQYLLRDGGACMGVAYYYQDVLRYHDTRFPDRQGHMAPCTNAFFLKNELSKQFPQLTTPDESPAEQGWRLRKHLIDNHLPMLTIPGFYRPGVADAYEGMVFFGEDRAKPLALHVLKGSHAERMPTLDCGLLQQILDNEKALWR